MAAAPGKQKELWQLRERIAEALLKVLLVDILGFMSGNSFLFLHQSEKMFDFAGWILLQV